ncbi:hypothetical protein HAX54_021077, partial [Datura stramonium]|nr:hypothetical protein [Datura stramonium]
YLGYINNGEEKQGRHDIRLANTGANMEHDALSQLMNRRKGQRRGDRRLTGGTPIQIREVSVNHQLKKCT